MRQLRTIAQAAASIKALDPETALTEGAIRRAVLQGRIASISSGNKRLVDLNDLDAYIESYGQACSAQELEDMVEPS